MSAGTGAGTGTGAGEQTGAGTSAGEQTGERTGTGTDVGDGRGEVDYLSVEDLVILAEVVLGRPPVIRDAGLLASAAARPATVVFDQVAYPTLFGKAAALLASVCGNHALLDGNKRLAWAATVTFLALNGVPVPEIDVDVAEEFMLAVAAGSLTEVAQLEAGLRRLYNAS